MIAVFSKATFPGPRLKLELLLKLSYENALQGEKNYGYAKYFSKYGEYEKPEKIYA